MKTRIEIKGENKNQVRAFANKLLTIIEQNPAQYDSIIRAEDTTSFNKLTSTFVAYQADRTEVDIKGLIADAKKAADTEEKEYDDIVINAIDDYCEEDDEFTSSYPDEIFYVEETKTTWEIFSSIYGEGNAARSYEKISYTEKEAIADYKENGIY